MGNEGSEIWTPGPWRWISQATHWGEESTSGSDLGAIVSPDGTCVCWFGNSETYYPDCGHEPGDADRDLMLASPALAKAAEFALSELPNRCTCHEAWSGRGLTDPDCLYCDYLPVIKALASALAQARGGGDEDLIGSLPDGAAM